MLQVTNYLSGRAYMLGQEATSCPQMSGEDAFLTQTRKQGIAFVSSLNRWVTFRELLLMQGFHTYLRSKVFSEMTSFDVALSSRDNRRAVEQSGNSMPVPFLTMCALYAWLVALAPTADSNGDFALVDATRLALRSAMRGSKRGRSH